jgi:hypothetical protein
MKKSFAILLVILVCLSSNVISQENETKKEDKTFQFQPKPLADDWNKWLIGEWEGVAESDAGTAKFLIKIDFVLNGQYLIMESESKITELSNKQRQYLKDTLYASDEDIEKYQNSTFKERKIYTIDPKTGEVIGYLFDSMRCIAEGRGNRQGNKEIIEWAWSGNAEGAKSITIIEKVDANKFTLNHKYILPNGKKMEDKTEITRVKTDEKGS